MILYINNEHCSSVEQLKNYFAEDLTFNSDTYADLLDYGRYGDIAVFLSEMGELEMASRVESISGDLGDSAFYAQLKAAILGKEAIDSKSLKPDFDKCFSFEGMKCDVKKNEAKVSISLKILMCVNEEYELKVSTNWGTRSKSINPSSFESNKLSYVDFLFHKRQDREFENISIIMEDVLLAETTVTEKNIENQCSLVLRDGILAFLENEDVAQFLISCFCKRKYLHNVALEQIDIDKICGVLNKFFALSIETPLPVGSTNDLLIYISKIIQNRKNVLKCNAQGIIQKFNLQEKWRSDLEPIATQIIHKNCKRKYIFAHDSLDTIELDKDGLICTLRNDFNCVVAYDDISSCSDYQCLKEFLISRI